MKMTRHFKSKLMISAIIGITIGLAFAFLKWWIVVFVLPLVVFYISRYVALRYYINMRDDANFRTFQGDATIKMCNEKINNLNAGIRFTFR